MMQYEKPQSSSLLRRQESSKRFEKVLKKIKCFAFLTGFLTDAGMTALVNYSLFIFLPLSTLTAQTIKTKYYTGSGFYINANGYIATCHHVIEHCSKDNIFVLNNKKEKIKLEYVASDAKNDLAILKSPQVKLYPHIVFSNNTDKLVKNDTVYIAGYPKGVLNLDFKKTRFRKAEKNNPQNQKNIIKNEDGLDTSISGLFFEPVANHGNSGGPLLNDSGHLIGIVKATTSLEKYEMNKLISTQNLDVAVSTYDLEVLMISNGLMPFKQESLWVLTDNQISEQANSYMMRIVCN